MSERERESERERGRSRPTLIDYTAIDRDPEKQALTFLLIELNTFYGANRWDGDDGGAVDGDKGRGETSVMICGGEICLYSLSPSHTFTDSHTCTHTHALRQTGERSDAML